MSGPEICSRHPLNDSACLADPALVFRSAAARDHNGKMDLNRCEDAVPVLKHLSAERILLGVADGLGGYAQGFDNFSGGQIASATAMKAAVNYFSHSFSELKPDAEALTNTIFKKLRHLAETRLAPSRLQGALGRHKLATTLALVVLEAQPERFRRKIQCFWIGDSRIYFFDRDGLHQLSRDDSLTRADAFNSVFDPSPMSQFLAASMERDWRIHFREFFLDSPGVVIACTDGCYSEWRKPWHYEAALQQALEHSESWPGWIDRIRMRLEPMLSDDASMAAFPINLSGFNEFKKLRTESNGILERCMAAEREGVLTATEIWSSMYKPVYERTPAVDPCPDSKTRPDECMNDPASNPESAAPITAAVKNFAEPARRRPRLLARLHSAWSRWGLAWFAGFVCGLPLGETVIAWLDLIWHWFKS